MIKDLPLDVSRETMERLKCYCSMLGKWSPKINLVAKSTLEDPWTRHVADSAQVFQACEHKMGHWVDLGAGGGFPGLVVAILAEELAPNLNVTLVESDARKCVFLRSVLRETGIDATVLTDRIEKIDPLNADVVSARALADLSTLLAYAARHLDPSGIALFPKGASWQKEVTAARESWHFSLEKRKSLTEPNAVILSIGALAHV